MRGGGSVGAEPRRWQSQRGVRKSPGLERGLRVQVCVCKGGQNPLEGTCGASGVMSLAQTMGTREGWGSRRGNRWAGGSPLLGRGFDFGLTRSVAGGGATLVLGLFLGWTLSPAAYRLCATRMMFLSLSSVNGWHEQCPRRGLGRGQWNDTCGILGSMTGALQTQHSRCILTATARGWLSQGGGMDRDDEGLCLEAA